ncbi:hypothetical protein [Stenotrophomonas sp. SORGH_AS_0321]|uniref:hypothetical protein n=1 Tax=Stenotrophomonas sp. SORGH_AS_0321 TaxID=3041787 RepID=UPI00285C0DE8|nr:hypothetical protein [Stenotrophomonas sp. SORGH_AS_0321]MDR6094934.1 hypothetical protein [Stenotrophomonas sp. SORGH_AS_0321]
MTARILGSTVTDRITGFKGVAVGHVEYLTGCNQTLVVPPVDAEGKLRDGQWFDDQRLQVSEGVPVTLDNSATPGHDAAPSRNY